MNVAVDALREELLGFRTEMRLGFKQLFAGQQQIAGMLQTLIDREDR